MGGQWLLKQASWRFWPACWLETYPQFVSGWLRGFLKMVSSGGHQNTYSSLALVKPKCASRCWQPVSVDASGCLGVLVSVRSGCSSVPGLGGGGRAVSRVTRGTWLVETRGTRCENGSLSLGTLFSKILCHRLQESLTKSAAAARPHAASLWLIDVRFHPHIGLSADITCFTCRPHGPATAACICDPRRAARRRGSGSLCPRHHPCPSRSVNKHHAARRDAYGGTRDGGHDAQSRGRAGT